MTMKPKPGNQPDSNDMAGPAAEEMSSHDLPNAHPKLEDEEEEAARLGDFA
jgi:hypothetical protein